MQLDIISVEFRNFLCFGNIWQKFTLKEGLNLIIGKKEGTSSSNASGKTSLSSAILFGLYGKIDKDVNKDQIPNWKNKKNCEVKLTFRKGEDEYIVHRGIAPNILKIYKNGEEEKQLSHSKEIQAEFEKHILGLDYETFLSIAHYNATQSQSIFNVSKGAKRAFLEKIFGLELYSDLAVKCNNKMSSVNMKMSAVQQELIFNTRSITEIAEQSESFESEIINLKSNDLERKREKLQADFAKINYEAECSKKLLEKSLANKEKLEEKIKELQQTKTNLEKEHYSLSQSCGEFKLLKEYQLNEEGLTDLVVEQKMLEKFSDVSNEEIEKQKSLTAEHKMHLDDLTKEITLLQGMKRAVPECPEDSVTECPLCGNQVSKDHIQQHIDKKMSEYEEKISYAKNLLTNVLQPKYEQENEILQSLLKQKEQFEKAQLKLKNLSLEIQNYKEIMKRQEKERKEQEKYFESREKIRELQKEIDSISLDLSRMEKLKEDLLFKEQKFQESLEVKAKIQSELEKLVTLEETQQQQIAKFEKFILENNEKISALQDKSKELQKQEKKYKNILDYLEFVKKLCKDEGVRNYAIQHTVPFLTQKINKYLADAGVSFYVKLDSNFNIEIRGTGIVNATFGSLSSGQQKVTNIATLLAFQDLYKLRSPLSPNILLLDEVLDSAIDSHTLTQIMAIIQEKQKEEHLKCYVISHRKEISEVTAFDSIIRVNNTSGFAKIEEVL